ncbi:MAG: hypothetical protein HXY49_07555 [Ignavibacteriaceae bacterium]|nr:hypothetical protein [Ignavibacteriaceae bacterium]
MKFKLTVIFFLFFSYYNFCQSNSLEINYLDKTFLIPAEKINENFYFSLNDFADVMELSYNFIYESGKIELRVEQNKLIFTSRNPFAVFQKIGEPLPVIYQLQTSVVIKNNKFFAPLNSSIYPLSELINCFITSISENRIRILPRRFDPGLTSKIESVHIDEINTGTVIKIRADNKIPLFSIFYGTGSLNVIVRNSELKGSFYSKLINPGFVDSIQAYTRESNVFFAFKLNSEETTAQIERSQDSTELLITIYPREESNWYEMESEHFRIIYREAHSSLVRHILSSAENSLKPLMILFNYTPSEKIVINTYDVSDYGFGATTTVPQNFLRLEIEPLEPGYEVVPYNERFQWLMSHELVHITVNDHSNDIEDFFRSIFSKVPPEQIQPVSVLFSLLTNYSRYTSRWHQEAPAVFIETWFSGGYGRTLGSFDEMYFRTMMIDSIDFPTHLELETILSHKSIFLENIFYLYGTRFITYLTLKYGKEKMLQWFKPDEGDFYSGFINKFENVFGEELENAWENFSKYEKDFQQSNINILNSVEFTPKRNISDESFGWVTQPYFDKDSKNILFGYHRTGELAKIVRFDLNTGNYIELTSMPSPSMIQVSSTAYDSKNKLFFFTTNNNQLYRDIWVVDAYSGKKTLLFEDCRTGSLTVSSQTHELWGVQHDGGRATLVYSQFPYEFLNAVYPFDIGDEIQQLSSNSNGKYLAAVLHKSTGQQSIILIETESLKNSLPVKYRIISSVGSPENPSWSSDDNFIFWNAYNNGVSNIYRLDINNFEVTAISHTLKGFFRPIAVSRDSLFVFEFGMEGFIPKIIPNLKAKKLPAIQYLGQKILNLDESLFNWVLKPANKKTEQNNFRAEESYNGLQNLKIQSFIPVITGFQKQKVLGFFTHISDPLLEHDLSIEAGYSPFNEVPAGPKFHFRLKYDYLQKFGLGIDQNATDFYDLFNSRKRGMIGTKLRTSYTFFWLYDNPLKIKHHTEVAYYTNVEFINDNLVRVSEPDFSVFQTNLNIKDIRRTIGSSDYESGNEFNFTILGFHTYLNSLNEFAVEGHAEWDRYFLWLFDHNVFHFKLAGGYHYVNEKIFQARYFFGGFGNREVENTSVRQFRSLYRFPGVPMYSIPAERFVKLMFENAFPPIRFGNISLGQHYLNHIDFSIYAQGLVARTPVADTFVSLGAQIDFLFKHWFNLETTFSAGIAKAWFSNSSEWEWFLSYKLLKN